MSSNHILIRGARQQNPGEHSSVSIPRTLVVITGLSGPGSPPWPSTPFTRKGSGAVSNPFPPMHVSFWNAWKNRTWTPSTAFPRQSPSNRRRPVTTPVPRWEPSPRSMIISACFSLGSAHPYCYRCQRPITSQSVDQIGWIRPLPLTEGTRIVILSPLVTQQKGSHGDFLEKLIKEGFARVRVNGNRTTSKRFPPCPKTRSTTFRWLWIASRSRRIRSRLADSLELAMGRSEGVVLVDVDGKEPILFSEKAACIPCGISYPELTPASFSSNSARRRLSKMRRPGDHYRVRSRADHS